MLYLIYGSDRHKVLTKSAELVGTLKKRKPDAEVFALSDDSVTVSALEELATGQGLFEQKHIVAVKDVFVKKEMAEDVLTLLPAFAASPNIFLFTEATLLKAPLEAFKKHAEQVQEFSLSKETTKPEFNLFALSDAFGARDRKALWVLYQKAIRHGASAEELSGILFWQVKNLFLADQYQSAGAAGLSPFVFTKAKHYARNFSRDEIVSLSSKLVAMYHDAHRGSVDFELSLERFVISV